jgi:hypothetical protein
MDDGAVVSWNHEKEVKQWLNGSDPASPTSPRPCADQNATRLSEV